MHPESGESAGISHDDLVRADIVMRLKKAHVTLAEPDKVPLPALQHMETVLLDGNWIGDEPALREVMLITLAALDPATYGDKPQNVTEGPIAELTHVFLHELHKNKVLSAVRLEAIKPKKGIVLPPLPSPPLRSEPRAGSPPARQETLTDLSQQRRPCANSRHGGDLYYRRQPSGGGRSPPLPAPSSTPAAASARPPPPNPDPPLPADARGISRRGRGRVK